MVEFEDEDGIVRCNCEFDVLPAEEKNCTVYGLLSRNKGSDEGVGDQKGIVVPWKRASEKCLLDLNITIRNMSYPEMFLMCPNRNGTDASGTAVTNLWRDETYPYLSEKTRNDTRAGSKFFEFDESGKYRLKGAVISRNGESVNCTERLAFCWDVISIYLGNTDEGVEDLRVLCERVWDVEGNNSVLEQSAAREQLCTGTSTSSHCLPLVTQIDMRKMKRDVDLCSEIGVPAAKNRVPEECDESAPHEEDVVEDTASGGKVFFGLRAAVIIASTTLLFLNSFYGI